MTFCRNWFYIIISQCAVHLNCNFHSEWNVFIPTQAHQSNLRVNTLRVRMTSFLPAVWLCGQEWPHSSPQSEIIVIKYVQTMWWCTNSWSQSGNNYTCRNNIVHITIERMSHPVWAGCVLCPTPTRGVDCIFIHFIWLDSHSTVKHVHICIQKQNRFVL